MTSKLFSNILLVFIIILSISAFAQGSAQQEYMRAKSFFKQQNFQMAEGIFKRLSTQHDQPFHIHASFYYGLCQYKLNQYDAAKAMYLQIIQKYTNWDQIDEVRYWLIQVYLQQKKYQLAYQQMTKIISFRVKQDAQASLQKAAEEEDDIQQLTRLLDEYPKDQKLAEQIALKIKNLPLDEQDSELLQQLVNNYKLDPSLFPTTNKTSTKRKEIYDIGILLPFHYDEAQQSINTNNFVLQTYNGIRLGAKKLNELDMPVRLHTFDTKRDSATTHSIIASGVLDSLDLIIGPLYPASSSLVIDYSLKHNINILNPLSKNKEVIGNNPFSYLFLSSEQTRAKVITQFAADSLPKNKAYLIYGDKNKDSVLMSHIQLEAKKQGLELLEIVQVNTDNVSAITLDIIQQIKSESITVSEHNTKKYIGPHLIVCVSQEIQAANILTELKKEGSRIPVFISEDWLQLNLITIDQLITINAYLYGVKLSCFSNDELENVKEAYTEAFHILPNFFALTGFEAMYAFGQMLHHYGTNLKGTEQTTSLPLLFEGHIYNQANDNQVLPIVRIKDGEVSLQNP